MPAFTTAQWRERLDAYLAAEAAILSGQSYKIGERMLTRADLATVTAQIKYLTQQLTQSEAADAAAAGRSRRLRFSVPG